jgi:hypothetical protein
VLWEKMSKLENKKIKCIFISYGINLKGNKIQDPMFEKVIYNRIFIFKEMNFFFIVL